MIDRILFHQYFRLNPALSGVEKADQAAMQVYLRASKAQVLRQAHARFQGDSG